MSVSRRLKAHELHDPEPMSYPDWIGNIGLWNQSNVNPPEYGGVHVDVCADDPLDISPTDGHMPC
ncbi:hypothetical protein Mapa_001676 [Marchantia paleacea]|nr:hypothetical protein Mapa_001676 [Marchantia paleacea]